MRIAVGAGHTLYGAGTGAVSGKYKESQIARDIVKHVISDLRAKGHTVRDCTVNSAATQNRYLKAQTRLANESNADIFLCVHLNASASHLGRGSEIYTWNGSKHKEAVKMLDGLENLGFKNRGVKKGNDFYIVKHSKMKALLIEVFFLDNEADQKIYEKHGVKKIAKAISSAI